VQIISGLFLDHGIADISLLQCCSNRWFCCTKPSQIC